MYFDSPSQGASAARSLGPLLAWMCGWGLCVPGALAILLVKISVEKGWSWKG